mmetsp:Transcript_18452/g.71265  ORF Transcript_18452/g.71265 Transcript_18452/m.71265 type:complete len:225 (-) Transcript_18452:1806-2480(-)
MSLCHLLWIEKDENVSLHQLEGMILPTIVVVRKDSGDDALISWAPLEFRPPHPLSPLALTVTRSLTPTRHRTKHLIDAWPVECEESALHSCPSAFLVPRTALVHTVDHEVGEASGKLGREQIAIVLGLLQHSIAVYVIDEAVDQAAGQLAAAGLVLVDSRCQAVGVDAIPALLAAEAFRSRGAGGGGCQMHTVGTLRPERAVLAVGRHALETNARKRSRVARIP